MNIEQHLGNLYYAYQLGADRPNADDFKHIVDWCANNIDHDDDETFQAMISREVGIDWDQQSQCPLIQLIQYQ